MTVNSRVLPWGDAHDEKHEVRRLTRSLDNWRACNRSTQLVILNPSPALFPTPFLFRYLYIHIPAQESISFPVQTRFHLWLFNTEILFILFIFYITSLAGRMLVWQTLKCLILCIRTGSEHIIACGDSYFLRSRMFLLSPQKDLFHMGDSSGHVLKEEQMVRDRVYLTTLFLLSGVC